MTRRKRKRVGGSYTQKPDDLRIKGRIFPVVVTHISDTPAQLRSNVRGS